MTKNVFLETMESLECHECGKKLMPCDACPGDPGIICQECLSIREMCPCGCQDNNKTCVYTPTNKDSEENTI